MIVDQRKIKKEIERGIEKGLILLNINYKEES